MSPRGWPAADGSREHLLEADYRTMFELAGVGTAQADPVTGRFLRVNPKMCQITGYSEEELLSTTFQGITHPDDRTEDFEGFRQMVRGEIPQYQVEKRYVRKDGQVVWVGVNATIARDEAGQPLRTVAVVQDIGERKRAEEELHRSEERFRGLAEGVNFIPWEADLATWRFTYVGPQAVKILGYPLEDWYRDGFWVDRIHPEDREWVTDYCATSSTACEHYRFEYRMFDRDGSTVWLDDIVHVSAGEDGRGRLRGVMVDVTERKRAEEAQRFLTDAGTVLSSSLDYEATLASVARLVVPRLADWCAVDVLAQDGTIKRLAAAHQDPEKVAWAHELQRRYPPDPGEPGGVPNVLRTGRPEFYPEVTEQMLEASARDEEHLELLREVGLTSAIIAPMVARGRTLGAITLVSAESGRTYEEADLKLAEELGRRAALAVDNAGLHGEVHSSRDELGAILGGVADGVTAQDPTGRLVYANEAAAKISGYQTAREMLEAAPGDALRKFEIMDEEGRPFPLERLPGRLALRGESSPPETLLRIREAATGEERWSMVKAKPVFDEEGRVRLAINIFRDVTGQRRAEQEIRTRARQQEVIADLGRRALAEQDPSVLMDEAVELVARTLKVEYCKVLELLPEGDALLLHSGVGWKEGLVGRATVGAGIDSQAGYTLISDEPVVVEDLRTEGRFGGPPLLHEHGVVSGISTIIRGQEKPFGVLGVHTRERRPFTQNDINFLRAVANVLADSVERKRAEEVLREVREVERDRMARDLHDGALQNLTYALAEAQLIQAMSEDPELDRRLGQTVDALKRAGQEIREAVYDLRVEEERDKPFSEQLESLVELNRRMALASEVRLDVEEGFPVSPLGEGDSELLRILQEALTNARKHSGAGNVLVRLGIEGNKLVAEVEDDGRGIAAQATGGVGQRSMRERARALGGSLKIESEPGRGTKVRFEMAPRTDDKETQSEEGLRILLVEDHTSFREATASIFEWEPGFEVVGQAGSLAEARNMLEDGASAADVALVDLNLPDGYGGDLIKELRAADPRAQALVLSASLDRAEIARAVEAGAAGVLHKSAGIDEVVESVRRLRAGETLLPLEEVVDLVRFASARKEQEYEARGVITQLTPREKEVLQALAEGLDGQQIAARLAISPVTERNHMANILAKLGVHSRLQALVFALRHGVVEVR